MRLLHCERRTVAVMGGGVSGLAAAKVFERGRTVWTGPAAGLTPEITDRYLGV